MAYCTIVPPYLLDSLTRSDDAELAGCARRTLELDDVHRQARAAAGVRQAAATDGAEKRSVYDAQHGTTLPGQLVRSEGQAPTGDDDVNRSYDHLGDTWTFYSEVYDRDSVDGNGLALRASVHYDQNYDNAFWNGDQMVFGDGDGTLFKSFTVPLDVTAHELTHGVTQYSANLEYKGQSGALNESVSDVFGSLVKQYVGQQTADQADWLIGTDLFAAGVQGKALRSMAAPGTAYDDPRLGKDPQPATMDGYVDTTDDNGGVHTNSGIPNHAFYLAATAIGGNAWEKAGLVWYRTLTSGSLPASADFATFANATVSAAGAVGQDVADAVRKAWTGVKVLT
ncbi:MAG: M4 family metallopeptidase [Acidothermales bacterium]|nr:M4 family metallopeptidase [Acidothermales bacterium]